MHRIPWLLAGILLGIAGVFIYQVFGRPALPQVEPCRIDFPFVYRR